MINCQLILQYHIITPDILNKFYVISFAWKHDVGVGKGEDGDDNDNDDEKWIKQHIWRVFLNLPIAFEFFFNVQIKD